jgi:hypothetical protein
MRTGVGVAVALVMLAAIRAGTSMAGAQTANPPAPTVRPAIDGILAAFERHPLVGLGDMHGMAQQQDFFVTVIRDSRFAKEVGNVVVEFGTATHQDILDRYVNGGNVSYAELRSVWSDVVGWTPTVTGLGYVNFFVQVRTTNLSLPPEQRVRVWLGEPVIDWSKVKTRDDIIPAMSQRDSYPAAVIKREIVAQGKKALVIYGNAHFGMPEIPVDPKTGDPIVGPKALRTLVEKIFRMPFSSCCPIGVLSRMSARQHSNEPIGIGPHRRWHFLCAAARLKMPCANLDVMPRRLARSSTCRTRPKLNWRRFAPSSR